MKSKKMKKILAIAIASTMVSTIAPSSASAAWFKDSQNNWNWTENGNKTIGWTQVDGTWYSFDANGIMQTGWVRAEDSKWYYMDSDGGMKTGWVQDTDGKWYFTDKSGAMQTGVVEVQGKVYVLETSGTMATGSTTIGGETYTIDASGAIAGEKLPTPEKVFANEGTVTALYTAPNSVTGITKDTVITTVRTGTDTTSSSGSSSSGGGGGSSSKSSRSSGNSNSNLSAGTTTTVGSSTNTTSSSSSTNATGGSDTLNSGTGITTTVEASTNTTSISPVNSVKTYDQKIEDALVAINNAADSTAMAILITDNAGILGLDLTDYNDLTDKTAVLEGLIVYDFNNKADFKVAFNSNVSKAFIKEHGISMGHLSPGNTYPYGDEKINESILAINNATDITAMASAITDNAEILGLDLTNYNALTDKAPVLRALIGNGFADRDDVKGDFNVEVLAQKTAEEAVADNDTTSPTDSSSSSEESTSNAGTTTTIIQKTEKSVAAVNNAADVTAMATIITDNAEILGIDLTAYNTLTDKTPVQRALIGKAFSGYSSSEPDSFIFFSKLNVRLAFDNAVYDQKVAEGNGISMNGSGLGYTEALAKSIAVINNAKDATEMASAIIDKGGILGMDLTDYNELKDKAPVEKALIGKFYSNLSEGISSSTQYSFIEELKSTVNVAFNDAVVAQKTAEQAAIDKDTISATNISLPSDSSTLNSGNTYTQNTEEAVAAINNAADVLAIERVITDNAEILGLDLTDYNYITDKTSVLSSLIGKGFDNKSDVKEAFNTEVTKAFVKEHGISMGYLYAGNTYTEQTGEAV